MADPLSITSGVVGILSLGIQVTQGLTTYYGLWKSHEDTLIHHDIRLDQLEKSLGILQTSISKLDHKDSLATQNVASTIVACENGMKKLKSSLDQCRLSPAQPGLHHRVRDTSRKALFPFKKATLDSLRSTVTELQSNVDNALQILGIDVLSNHGLAISTVVLASSRIDKGVHDTRSDLQGLGQSLDTWFENVNTNIKTTTEAAIVTILDQLGQQLIDLKTDQHQAYLRQSAMNPTLQRQSSSSLAAPATRNRFVGL
ncbi:hypothetical protein MMC19_002876 [Ptychographa xylographoides]|nr:hypothetical protein [Ptychographa xylographoides]